MPPPNAYTPTEPPPAGPDTGGKAETSTRIMNRMRRWIPAIVVGLVIAPQSFPEYLPVWEVDHAVLDSDLIVEGKLERGNVITVVTVTKTHRGPAKVGDRLIVERFHELPTIGFQDWPRSDPDSDEGMPTMGQTAVLFLTKQEDRASYRLFGWASGVRWILNRRVFEYIQPVHPGPYYLLPDPATPTPGELRAAIRSGLKKRAAFEQALQLQDLDLKAETLSRFIQPAEPYHYFRKAVDELQDLRRRGALVFQRELRRPEQDGRRRELVMAIGRSGDQESVPFLVTLIERAKAGVSDIEGTFDWSEATEEERRAMSEWHAAIDAAAALGSAEALPELREAAVWGARHGDQRILKYAVRGMRRNPVEANLSAFQEIFAALPMGTRGFDTYAAYHALLSLRDHQFLESVPILASQLDHPDKDNRRLAHRGLEKLAGTDLGMEKKAWLEWYALHSEKGSDR